MGEVAPHFSVCVQRDYEWGGQAHSGRAACRVEPVGKPDPLLPTAGIEEIFRRDAAGHRVSLWLGIDVLQQRLPSGHELLQLCFQLRLLSVVAFRAFHCGRNG